MNEPRISELSSNIEEVPLEELIEDRERRDAYLRLRDKILGSHGGRKTESRQLSRRNFLKAGLSSSAAVFNKFPLNLLSRPNERSSHLIDSQEIKERFPDLYGEIAMYRKRLGLTEDPMEWKFIPSVLGVTPEFVEKVNIAPINQSYATRSDELLEIIFGGQQSKYVWKVRTSDDGTSVYSFLPRERTFFFDDNVRDSFPELKDFTGLFLHECAGHGVDPILYLGNVPMDLETYVKIVHGKWRALSEAFSVDQEFFRHPGDATLKRVKFAVARELGMTLVSSSFSMESITNDGELQEKIKEFILQVSNKERIEDVKFSRKVCNELGDFFVEFLLNNPEFFEKISSGIIEKYREEVEGALREIFAEMVRLSLIPKESLSPFNNLPIVRNNTDIGEGISEIFSAIWGRKVSLLSMRSDINRLIENVQSESHKRWEEEKEAITEMQNGTPETTNNDNQVKPETNEIVQAQSEHIEEVETFEDALENFYKGELPDGSQQYLSSDVYTLIKEYALEVHKLTSAYPTFKGNTGLADISSMHVWDSEFIEYLCNERTIRELVSLLLKKEDVSKYIAEKDFTTMVYILRYYNSTLSRRKKYPQMIKPTI